MTTSIALVGGGVSVAALVPQVAGGLAGRPLELRLAARDPDRLEVVARHCRHLVADRPDVAVTASPAVQAAIEGADVVVVMLRVGGLAARVADDHLAQRFGVPGDEGLGPGGWANGLRTMPVVASLADDVARLAPGATVLNLVAPLGLTTRVLTDRGVPAIGVCELPGVTERSLRAVLADPTAPLAYAGYNHLGWFWPRSGRPEEVLAPAVEARLVDAGVLERFGAVALKYYYWLLDLEGAARLGISRPPDRSASLVELRDHALEEMRDAPTEPSPSVAARATPWFDDALVPMLDAVVADRPWTGYANLPNGTSVPQLGADHVVEVPVTVDGDRAHPVPLDVTIPPPVLDFLLQVGRCEELLHRAWAEDAPDLVEEAIRSGPQLVDPTAVADLARAVRAAATDHTPPGVRAHERRSA
jgi:6-phospho-beta-glucosidase